VKKSVSNGLADSLSNNIDIFFRESIVVIVFERVFLLLRAAGLRRGAYFLELLGVSCGVRIRLQHLLRFRSAFFTKVSFSCLKNQ
jgi:hypothetical protein